MSAFNTDYRGNLPPLRNLALIDNNQNGSLGSPSQNASQALHSKVPSVSFLDFGSAPLFLTSRPGALQQGSVKPQTINASPSTAMAILSPPASRYAFDKSAGGTAGGPVPSADGGEAMNTSNSNTNSTSSNSMSGSNPSFFNPNSKPNYSNLGNDWALNLNFSLSKNLNSSNPELSSSNRASPDNRSNAASTANNSSANMAISGDSSSAGASSFASSSSASFDKNLEFMKKWLDQSNLEEKHLFIDELIDYFLFTPDHSTDLINYLKLKIDRVSFNDDLDSPTTATPNNVGNGPTLATPAHVTSSAHLHNPHHHHHAMNGIHSQQHSINNLDSILSSASMDPGFNASNANNNRLSKNYLHTKANLVHVPLSHARSNGNLQTGINNTTHNNTNNNNQNPVDGSGQTVLTMPNGSKDQPQVFSPLLTESGFLQNQAMRYANGNRSTHSRAHSKSTSVSSMPMNATNNNNSSNNHNNNSTNNGGLSQGANNDILNSTLMSPVNTSSFGNKRGNNSLSINTTMNAPNGPTSVSVGGPASANAANNNPVSNLTSPTSPMTPGGYNLEGLDPLTRLKLQALSTINSRSKLDALKKTVYNDQGRVGNLSSSSVNQNGKSYKSGQNRSLSGSQIKSDDSGSPSGTRKKNSNGNLNQKKQTELEESFNASKMGASNNSTQNKNLAQALKSLQSASSESAAIINNAQGLYQSDSGSSLNSAVPTVGTPVKAVTNSTLSLLSPKSPGLNSIELIELKNLNDLPVWLKNLRLHKYTKILENYKWKELVYFNDSKLEEIGVSALGARRKLLKAFDIVKVAYENGDIIGLNK